MRPGTGGPTGFFTTRELFRLSSAIFLLGIVGLLYLQTKKSSSWRTIAAEEAETESPSSPALPVDSPWTELVAKHPGHTDLEEIDALKEELQAVSDMTPLAAEEMPAYWRMAKWAYAVPGAELRKQARTDLLFTHLFQNPNKNRGALVNVKLHVRRVLHHDAPENSAQVKNVYEAWGPTEESQTFPYCVVFVDLPPGVKVQASAFFDARFVGFFLKKLRYEDSSGTSRSAPLLIGRMIYDEEARLQNQPKADDSVLWIVGVVAVLVGIVLLIQWWAKSKFTSQRVALIDEAAVDAFLDGIELPGQSPDRNDAQRQNETKPPDAPATD